MKDINIGIPGSPDGPPDEEVEEVEEVEEEWTLAQKIVGAIIFTPIVGIVVLGAIWVCLWLIANMPGLTS